MTTRRHQGKSKWYQYLLRNESNTESSMNISRPGTSTSQSSTQLNIDSVNWHKSRISCDYQRPLDIAANVLSKIGPSKMTDPDYENIIRQKSASRPLSVTLSKYSPLPAISTSANTTSNETTESPDVAEESDDDEEDYSPRSEDDLSAEIEINPPKLMRSRTFEVITTNLGSLPIIDNDRNQSVPSSDIPDASLCANDNSTEDGDIGGAHTATAIVEDCSEPERDVETCHCILTVDGMPLPEYMAHERRRTYHNGMSINDILDGFSRPPSRSSLMTHPGTPDSLFSNEITERIGTAEISNKSSRSSRYTVIESEERDEDSLNADDYHYIKFPGDNLIALPWTEFETVKELVQRIEAMQLNNKPIQICDLDYLSEDLALPMSNFGIDQNSTINLLDKMPP